MAAEMKCPETGNKCLVDPIGLEGRLTRIETKLDQVIKDLGDTKAVSSSGVSGKAVAGYSTLFSGLVIGIIEALRAYFSAKGQGQ